MQTHESTLKEYIEWLLDEVTVKPYSKGLGFSNEENIQELKKVILNMKTDELNEKILVKFREPTNYVKKDQSMDEIRSSLPHPDIPSIRAPWYGYDHEVLKHTIVRPDELSDKEKLVATIKERITEFSPIPDFNPGKLIIEKINQEGATPKKTTRKKK